jgi:ankyrin repeat protein
MKRPRSLDQRFQEAVAAIDAGDVATLERLLADDPQLVRDRLAKPGAWLRDKVGGALKGFFRRPYLLWFVAEDPVRNGTLPSNIAAVARTIIAAAERVRVDSLREQLDYALRLVSWSWIARDAGVQLELIDVLVDAGASPDGNPDNALVNGHFAAAAHLVQRGAPLTLATALCLGRWDDARRLALATSARDRQFAYVLAALNGKADALRLILDLGVDLNGPSPDLYSHGTPLHHAVWSGSLEAVKVLVEAGAALGRKDTLYDGTPQDWAEHGAREQAQRPDASKRYAEIAAYLDPRS